ncbi:MAG TPA: NfeD family protein [Candidatus Jeotgalibaca merdavium]|uniref:NfeD family protein n=1 Tax=Candidatus Jeotgalibaca merdavium TaxID=2838627 RepID=A0A9D2KYH1_9LACT|nr:NfeD family protein [Candidatus Jeotgalibaca merdavium]
MSALFESMTLATGLMAVGIVGALICIPIKDIISVDFYDICDLFISLFFVGLISTKFSMESSHQTLLLIALFLAISLVIILIKLFVFVPFQAKAETNALLSRKDYIGEKGRVTVTINSDTVGEVVLYTIFGNVPMTAKIYQLSYDDSPLRIATGEQIRVMDIDGAIVYVTPYEEDLFLPPLESHWGKIK